MSSLLRLAVGYSILHVIQSQCTWEVTNAGAVKTLDLSCLDDKQITTQDTGATPHDYIWSICENGVTCGSQASMVCMRSIDGSEYIIGRWDSSISPAYIEENGQPTWTFQYANGDTDCGQPARTWAPSFVCNEDKYFEIGKVTEEPGACYYQVTIETMFACDGTHSCHSGCIYTNGSYTLDLSSLRGELLSAPLNTSAFEYFIYTPCQNTAKCTSNIITSKPAMAFIYDFNHSKCLDVVAEWDDGYAQPVYLQEAGLWQLTYANGGSCHGEPTVFNLELICDEAAKDPRILQAQRISECVYEMVIASVLACA